MKDNTFKLAVLVCLVLLVAIVGISAYVLVNNQSKALNTTLSSNQNTSNSNNVTVNSTKNNSSSKKQGNSIHHISPTQALEIANNYEASYGEEAVGLNAINLDSGKGMYNGGIDGDPFYHVYLKSKDPNQHVPSVGYVEIDEVTGAINPRG